MPTRKESSSRSPRAHARQRGALLPQALAGLPESAARLSWGARLDVIDAWATVLDGLYAHLPLKRALYGFDVLRALDHLRRDVPRLSDLQFHRELMLLVNRLRDAHTQYEGPEDLAGRVASLPFLVESFGPAEAPQYVVTKVAEQLVADPHFVRGVTIEWWNGIPFDRAVDLYAESATGGRPDSRRARALESLTLRSLADEPAPDEHWVIVGFRDGAGKLRQARFDWIVIQPDRAPAASGGGVARRRRAINRAAESVRRAKKLLFNPQLWEAERRPPRSRDPRALAVHRYGDFLSARVVQTRHGKFGYLRIWSFDVADDERFVQAAVKLLRGLPARGLIIDVRDNPGGLIWAAERLLQIFTPGPIVPTRFAWRVTPLTAALSSAPYNRDDFGDWAESLAAGLANGEPYTSHIPITPEEQCNDLGQHYGGPVVLVTDANTYSAGDLFSAGFLDNGLGPIVCVGEATGAGGACVWEYEEICAAMNAAGQQLPTLPAGVSFRAAVQRAVRSGSGEGALIEDAGVPGEPYDMTARDVLGKNEDLLEHCAELLAAQPLTMLEVVRRGRRLVVQSAGLDQLDVYVNRRPAGPPIQLQKDGRHGIAIPREARDIDLIGWSAGNVRQRRRVHIRNHA